MKHWHFSNVPTPQQIDDIADCLGDGAVLLLPTDTIYGLHALADSEDAVARVAAIKGRDGDKPFVVLGASAADFEKIGITIPERYRQQLDGLWPAPLTAILPLQTPIAASRGAQTLACRVPALDWLRELLARTGPLVSTSANRSGQPPVDRPDALELSLQTLLDGIVDAGALSGEPSTIVDLSSDTPEIKRTGDVFFSQKVWKTLRKNL